MPDKSSPFDHGDVPDWIVSRVEEMRVQHPEICWEIMAGGTRVCLLEKNHPGPHGGEPKDSMWDLESLARCLLATPKGAPINEGLARDLARAALEADDKIVQLEAEIERRRRLDDPYSFERATYG